MINLVQNHDYSNKPNTDSIFDELKQTTVIPYFNMIENSIELENKKHALKNNLMKPELFSYNDQNFNSINLTSNKKEIVYDNYYNSCFGFKSNIDLENKNCFGIEQISNSKLLESSQYAPAVICYTKSNYILVYSPVTQNLSIILETSFSTE